MRFCNYVTRKNLNNFFWTHDTSVFADTDIAKELNGSVEDLESADDFIHFIVVEDFPGVKQKGDSLKYVVEQKARRFFDSYLEANTYCNTHDVDISTFHPKEYEDGSTVVGVGGAKQKWYEVAEWLS